MGIATAKAKIKDILTTDLIDIAGSINVKGNYIHLNGTSKENPLETKFNFTITIAGHSLTGSDDSIEPILSQALNDIYEYELENVVDLSASSKVVLIDDLLGYELKISIVDLTVEG
ncbi:MAG: hypothetical protein C0625_15345 [Arcobacter sp.]|nr:MAG: hypothetical protein C0625_15345 [Arcobacter sp.]